MSMAAFLFNHIWPRVPWRNLLMFRGPYSLIISCTVVLLNIQWHPAWNSLNFLLTSSCYPHSLVLYTNTTAAFSEPFPHRQSSCWLPFLCLVIAVQVLVFLIVLLLYHCTVLLFMNYAVHYFLTTQSLSYWPFASGLTALGSTLWCSWRYLTHYSKSWPSSPSL